MTNQQLYFAIGVPAVLILLNSSLLFALFIRLDARIEKVGESLESKMDARFDKVDARFEKVDARFEKVEARFEKMERQIGLIQGDLKEFYAEQRVHKEAIDTLKTKLQ